MFETKPIVNMSDYRDEHGQLDWDAYKKAERNNGESCTKCSALIYPPKGYPAKCHECSKLQSDAGEVEHKSNIRCPACGYHWSPWDSDHYALFADGEHTVGCHDCGHEFTITTYVSYSFKSPARLPEEEEAEDESEDEDDE